MKQLSKRIKVLRKSHGWNHEHVGKYLNISGSAYSKIEAGIAEITMSTLEDICNLFEVSPAYLITGKEPDHPYSIEALNNYRLELSKKTKEVIDLQKKIIMLYDEIKTVKALKDFSRKETVDECVAECAV